jgi:hypothetical protein
MENSLRIAVVVLVLGGHLGTGRAAMAAQDAGRENNRADSYESTLRKIAKSIEALKAEYPQLSEFSASVHCDFERLKIDYETLKGINPDIWRAREHCGKMATASSGLQWRLYGRI